MELLAEEKSSQGILTLQPTSKILYHEATSLSKTIERTTDRQEVLITDV